MVNFNGRRIFFKDVWFSSDHIRLFTDASSSCGFAAVFDSKWLYGGGHKEFQSGDITLLELFPIMLAVDIWGNQLANSCVMSLIDNQALVSIINSQSCKSSQIMKLVRHLVLKCMPFNIHFKAKHIPDKHNVLADLLSRSRLQDARAHTPWLEQIDTKIPDHLPPVHWLV